MSTANRFVFAVRTGWFFTILFLATAALQPVRASNFYQGVATNTPPWTGGIVPYLFDTNITPQQQAVYLAGMKEWELAGNVHFVPYTNQSHYVLLRFDYMGGTDTFVATVPEAVMTVDTLSRAQVGHETGHLLGYQHEHVRIDRDTNIIVNFANMIGNGSGAGTNGSGEGASISNLYVIDTNSTAFGAYDFESVMHYGRTLFSQNPDTLDTVDPRPAFYAKYYYRIGNYALSPGDRAGIAYLYGPPQTALTNVVTNTLDTGLGTLRAAIYYANDHPGATVRFNIPTNDPGFSNGVYTIYLTGDLPPLVANGTVIDATTQPGYTNRPVVAISGTKLIPEIAFAGDAFVSGLRVYAANCTISGLSIYGFSYQGIVVQYAFAISNRIQGCYIGLAPNSTNVPGNAFQGISIDTGASHTFVGGTNTVQRNVISGNAQYGIWISGTNGLPGATVIGSNTFGTVIQGNYIGTDGSGSVALPNGFGGIITTSNAGTTTVGGAIAGAGNVLSGNTNAGLWLVGVSNSVVQGNYIGLNAAGTAMVPNTASGIYVVGGSTSNLIGGTASGARNVISGNPEYGIYISDAGSGNTVVQGNYIGTDTHGTNALGNGATGVGVDHGAVNVQVGGTNAGAGNLISGNGDGIDLLGAGVTGVQIYGNYIGVSSNGLAAVPNSNIGIYLVGGPQSNSIGGILPGEANLISGNGNDGVQLYGAGTSFNTIQGNYIGTTSNGLSPLGNLGSAVSFFFGASNILGGTNPAARNLLCASTNNGVFIYYASNSIVQGNYIGVGADGATSLGNGLGPITNSHPGVYLENSGNTLIGGTNTGAGNIISGGGNGGVQLFGPGSSFDVIQGNYIGTATNGLVARGNGGSGVSFIGGAQSNTLGGTTAAARNLICASGGVGVYLNFAYNNTVQGNYIGVGADGATALGNQNLGVYVNTGTGNLIGGAVAGAGNVIANSGGDGLQFYGAGTASNTVQGNLVGTTKTGTNAAGNLGSGLSLIAGPAGNTIGGSTALARNVFAASQFDGIYMDNASNNIIQGNYIGTDSTGLRPLGNGFEGVVMLDGSSGNQIGGAGAGQGNVIAASTYHGIYTSDAGTTGNIIQGNNIGAGADGAKPMGNGLQGILLQAGASSNVIGLALNGSGTGNIIADNVQEGVIVTDPNTIGNVIRGNSIYNNGALGINLVGGTENPAGVTSNHIGGAVAGPEDLQNYPVITNAAVTGSTTTISGTLNSTAGRGFLIDVFRNTNADTSGFGEGQVYVGSAALTTGGSGNGSFTLTAPGAFAGQYFTVVAVDGSTGDTSEFGLDFTATNGPMPPAFIGPYTWNSSNGFSFSMSLQVSQSYTIQATTNLSTNPIPWITLTNFTATNTTTLFTDRSATNRNIRIRFYRISSP